MLQDRPTDSDPVVAALLEAYRRGYFPMANPARPRSAIEWFNPPRRGILPLEGLHVPASLRQRVRSGRFEVTADRCFERVIRGCAEGGGPDRTRTWIDGRLIAAYTALHRAGHAHSVEAWLPDAGGEPVLVGGLYGVHLGGLFAGESMFSRPALGGTDASKVCLVHLVAHLRRRGFALLDIQFGSAHLARLGAVEISRAEYLCRLGAAVAVAAMWGRFEAPLE